MKKILVFALVILAALAAVQSYTFQVAAVLQDSGYAVVDNAILKNLQSDHENVKETEIPAMAVEASDFLYTRGKSYYLGESKQKLNAAFPLFVNSSTTVLNMNDSSVLMNRAFETLDTYDGLYLTDGVTFNADRQQADGDEFILLGLQNGLSVIAQPMEVTTNMGHTEVAMNSIVRFGEKEIRYYSLEGDTFIYHAIPGVNEQTTLLIGQNSYNYEDFLSGLLRTGASSTVPAVLPPIASPSSSEVPEKPTAPPQTRPTDGQSAKPAKPADSGSTAVPEPSPQPWQKPELSVEPWEVTANQALSGLSAYDPAQVLQLVRFELYPLQSKTLVGLREFDYFEDAAVKAAKREILFGDLTKTTDYMIRGRVTYLDEQGQSVTELFYSEVITTKSRNPGDGDGTEGNDGSGGGGAYVRPTVELEPFVPDIYQISSPSIVVNDPSGRIVARGVSFELLQDGKSYRRKVVLQNGPVTIGPLPPDSQFVIRGTITYLNEKNVEVTELFYGSDSEPVTIKTLDYRTLSQMQMSFAEGGLSNSSVELVNLAFLDNPNDPIMEEIANPDDPENPILRPTGKFHKYGEETIPYVSRVSMSVERALGGHREFVLPGSDLLMLKKAGSLPRFVSTLGQLPSNSDYAIALQMQDQFGNLLPLATVPELLDTHTAKKPPAATIVTGQNEVASTKLTIHAEDDDMAVEGFMPLFLQVVTSEGNPIPIEVEGNTGGLAPNYCYQLGNRDAVVGKNVTARITNLPANQIFTARVLTTYDLNDGMGIVGETIIGETRFATASLEDLGPIYLRSNIVGVTDSSATLQVMTESKTNSLLLQLLSEVKISLVPQGGKVPDSTLTLAGEELAQFLGGEHDICKATGKRFTGLDSFQEYTLQVSATAIQGGVQNSIMVKNTLERLFTLRAQPSLSYDTSVYITGNTIEYFDFKIIDPDNAISKGDVVLEVYDLDVDSTRLAIPARSFKTNTYYNRVTFEKLQAAHRYRFDFIGSGYSQAYSPISYSVFRFTPFELTTVETISGKLVQQGVNYYRTGEGNTVLGQQLFDKNAPGNSMNSILVASTGATSTHSTHMVTDYIPVIPGATYLSLDSGASPNYALYDSDKKFISYQTTGGISTYSKFTIEKPNAAYIRLNLLMDKASGFTFKLDPATDRNTSRGMVASLGLTVQDNLRYLAETEKFTLRVYRANGTNLPENHPFTNPTDTNYPLTQVELGTSPNPISINRTINMDTKSNSTYKVELLVKLYNRDIVLGSVRFTTQDAVIPIYTAQDMANINQNLSGKYIVMNDITFLGSINMGNTPSDYFTGELDFNGHTLTRTITDSSGYGVLFYNVGTTGVVKNAVIDYTHARTSNNPTNVHYSAICTRNYGTISNVILNIKGMSNSGSNIKGGITYDNMPGAVVENFVVNITGDVSLTSDSSGAVFQNWGTVRNGYLCGKPLPSSIASSKDGVQGSGSNVSGLVGTNFGSGIVENIYSLCDLYGLFSSSGNALLVSRNLGGTIRNSFTTGNIYGTSPAGDATLRTDLPPVVNEATFTKTQNLFYFSDYSYVETATQKRLPKQALLDAEFHRQLLGNSFRIDELVPLGYFPQVKMPDCMPQQPRTALPTSTSDQIVLTNIQSEGTPQNNEGTAVFSFRNPAAVTIKSIQVEHLTATVLEQTHQDGYTRVRVRLNHPQRFVSQYSVTSFQYAIGTGMSNGTVECAIPTYLNMSFNREITKASQWKELQEFPAENFRITADLDLQYLSYKDLYVPDTFSGSLDGGIYDQSGKLTGMHTLSNPRSNTRSVFNYVSGTIKNLRIDNLRLMDTPNDSSGIGFIYMVSGGAIDNLHFFDAEIISGYRAGTLAALMSRGTVTNCSATGTTLLAKDRTNGGPNAQHFGGLVGQADTYSSISNCYVSNLSMNATGLTRVEAMGGIVGNLTNFSSMESCYATGSIDTMMPYVGGLVGRVSANSRMVSCWSGVDITTGAGTTAGIIGQSDTVDFDKFYPKSNLLAIGSVYSRLNGSTTLGRIVPAGTRLDAEASTYASDTQVVEGTPESLATDTVTKLLTQAELCQPKSYYNLVGLTSAFDCSDVVNGNLPLLRRTDSNILLPFQQPVPLPSPGDVSIENIVVSEIVQSPPSAKLYIEVRHLSGVTVTGVQVEGMELAVDVPPTVIRPGTTVLQYSATPKHYWDSYRILSIGCGNSVTVPVTGKKVEAVFYKDISNVTQWNEMITADSYENYRITGDIDFTGMDSSKINHGLRLNRLEGLSGSSGKPTIKNLELEPKITANGLIDVASSSINNLAFDNIKIKGTRSISGLGIIATSGSRVKDVDFRNITITCGGANNVGCIGIGGGSIENITMDDINVTGNGDYYGGLCGYVKNSSSTVLRNITANNIDVSSTGSYIGGIVGISEGTLNSGVTISDVRGSNMSAEGLAYVGGIAGAGNCLGVTLTGATVKAINSFVGGIVAYTNTLHDSYIAPYADHPSEVTAGTSRAGGVVGHINSATTNGCMVVATVPVLIPDYSGTTPTFTGKETAVYMKPDVTNMDVKARTLVGGFSGGGGTYPRQCHVYSTNVMGDTIVGGLMGMGSGQTPNANDTSLNNLVCNVIVTGRQDVGGGVGAGAARHISVVDSTVNGGGDNARNIGGVAGRSDSPFYYDTAVNVKVNAPTADNVGGVIGYHPAGSFYQVGVQNTTVIGNNNVGGIVGKTDSTSGEFYRSIVASSTVTANGSNAGGMVGQMVSSIGAPLISRSYVMADVTAADYAGGLVGYSNSLQADAINTLVMTNVTTTGKKGGTP